VQILPYATIVVYQSFPEVWVFRRVANGFGRRVRGAIDSGVGCDRARCIGFDGGAIGSALGAIERGAIGSSFRYEGTVPVGAHNLGCAIDGYSFTVRTSRSLTGASAQRRF